MAFGPSPDTPYPLAGVTRTGFLKTFITRPTIIVGDYTYYDDPEGPEQFEQNVLYHFDFIGDKLIIGRYCCIAAGVRFIMNGGNHATTWLTSYPFPIFASEDIAVYLNGAKQASGIIINGAGLTAGGTVTFDTAPAGNTIVTLARELPIDVPWGIARVHGRQLLPASGAQDGFYYARLLKDTGA